MNGQAIRSVSFVPKAVAPAREAMMKTKKTQQRRETIDLTVANLALEDTWKDIVRIKKDYRKDRHGKHIRRGTICRITVGDRSKWVIVHGRRADDAVIEMDLNVRIALDVDAGKPYAFTLDRLTWIRSLWFPWKASDPIYRLPAQLSIVSFLLGVILGVLGIIVGLVPLFEKQARPASQPTHVSIPTQGLKCYEVLL